MERVSSNFTDWYSDVVNVSTEDGVRIELDGGWMLIRPSGTEPLMRITVEARDMRRAEELLEISKRFVKNVVG